MEHVTRELVGQLRGCYGDVTRGVTREYYGRVPGKVSGVVTGLLWG